MSSRKTDTLPLWQRWQTLLFSSRARPIRFIITGGTSACVQLGILDILIHYNVNPDLANIAAFLLSAQFNFLVSSLFTWRDRKPLESRKRTLLQRWVTFHGSIVGTAILNILVFTLARQFMSTLIASASGILVAALANFFMMNNLIFRAKQEIDMGKVDLGEHHLTQVLKEKRN